MFLNTTHMITAGKCLKSRRAHRHRGYFPFTTPRIPRGTLMPTRVPVLHRISAPLFFNFATLKLFLALFSHLKLPLSVVRSVVFHFYLLPVQVWNGAQFLWNTSLNSLHFATFVIVTGDHLQFVREC